MFDLLNYLTIKLNIQGNHIPLPCLTTTSPTSKSLQPHRLNPLNVLLLCLNLLHTLGLCAQLERQRSNRQEVLGTLPNHNQFPRSICITGLPSPCLTPSLYYAQLELQRSIRQEMSKPLLESNQSPKLVCRNRPPLTLLNNLNLLRAAGAAKIHPSGSGGGPLARARRWPGDPPGTDGWCHVGCRQAWRLLRLLRERHRRPSLQVRVPLLNPILQIS